jgi:hypothetical protein
MSGVSKQLCMHAGEHVRLSGVVPSGSWSIIAPPLRRVASLNNLTSILPVRAVTQRGCLELHITRMLVARGLRRRVQLHVVGMARRSGLTFGFLQCAAVSNSIIALPLRRVASLNNITSILPERAVTQRGCLELCI